MIVLPVKEHQGRDYSRSLSARQTTPASLHAEISGDEKRVLPGADYPHTSDAHSISAGKQEKIARNSELDGHASHHRDIVPRGHEVPPTHPSPLHHPQSHKVLHHDMGREPVRATEAVINDNQIRAKDTERLRIEKDLQRQRMIAISGRTLKATTDSLKKPLVSPGRLVINYDSSGKSPEIRAEEQAISAPAPEKNPEQKTVIIGKRKTIQIKDQNVETDRKKPAYHEDQSISPDPDADSPPAGTDDLKLRVKDPRYRAKDDIFGGKGVSHTEVPSARDSGLIHTQLVQKKGPTDSTDKNESEMNDNQAAEQSKTSDKKRKITIKNDDISWI
jgi:hypothetical protein